MRIVSLLPSATEILFQLGLGDQVVGVTFECDFPDEARSKRIVSTSALPEGLTPAEIDAVVKQRMAHGDDLYHLDRDAFAAIDPTLVVTQDLCVAPNQSRSADRWRFLQSSALCMSDQKPRNVFLLTQNPRATGAGTEMGPCGPFRGPAFRFGNYV